MCGRFAFGAPTLRVARIPARASAGGAYARTRPGAGAGANCGGQSVEHDAAGQHVDARRQAGVVERAARSRHHRAGDRPRDRCTAHRSRSIRAPSACPRHRRVDARCARPIRIASGRRPARTAKNFRADSAQIGLCDAKSRRAAATAESARACRMGHARARGHAVATTRADCARARRNALGPLEIKARDAVGYCGAPFRFAWIGAARFPRCAPGPRRGRRAPEK